MRAYFERNNGIVRLVVEAETPTERLALEDHGPTFGFVPDPLQDPARWFTDEPVDEEENA